MHRHSERSEESRWTDDAAARGECADGFFASLGMTGAHGRNLPLRLVRGLIVGVGGWAVFSVSAIRAAEGTVPEKVPAPAALASSASLAPLPAFEKKFRVDTGEGALTPRTEIQRTVVVKVGAKEKRIFKLDLNAWPAALRPPARLWLAVAAPSTITTEGPLRLEFSQGGVSMSTAVDYTFNMDGMILLGCDYAVRDGEVSVEVDNGNHLTDVPCTLHAIVYVPRKISVQ